MAYDSAVSSFTTKTDKVDLVQAAHMNAVQSELVTIENILGTNVKGNRADLKTRLNNALDADGSLLSGTAFPSPGLTSQMFYRTDLNKAYIYDGASWNELGASIDYTAGSQTEGTATTERSTNAGTYTKIKQFTPVTRGGIVTVSYQMKTDNVGNTAYAKVYVNGVAAGAENTTNSDSYVDKSDASITVVRGDVVQIYAKGNYAYVKNAYIKTAKPTLPGEESGL